MTSRSPAFTVIELLFIVAFVGAASVLFFIQKSNVEVAARDQARKTSINAMYYSLEEVFYKTNSYYPQIIEPAILPSVEPSLFKDPTGVTIGDGESDFRYEPVGCVDTKCTGYTLRTTLENEADFVKTNRAI